MLTPSLRKRNGHPDTPCDQTGIESSEEKSFFFSFYRTFQVWFISSFTFSFFLFLFCFKSILLKQLAIKHDSLGELRNAAFTEQTNPGEGAREKEKKYENTKRIRCGWMLRYTSHNGYALQCMRTVPDSNKKQNRNFHSVIFFTFLPLFHSLICYRTLPFFVPLVFGEL